MKNAQQGDIGQETGREFEEIGGSRASVPSSGRVQLKRSLAGMTYAEQVAALRPPERSPGGGGERAGGFGSASPVQRSEDAGGTPAEPAPDPMTPFRIAARIASRVGAMLPSVSEETRSKVQGVLDRMVQQGAQPDALQDWGQEIRQNAEGKDEAREFQEMFQSTWNEAMEEEGGG